VLFPVGSMVSRRTIPMMVASSVTAVAPRSDASRPADFGIQRSSPEMTQYPETRPIPPAPVVFVDRR